MVKLDIISDPVCPWCYIGKTNLEAALANRPDHPFVIEWHPFQLNPDMAPEGVDTLAHFHKKFGGPEGMAAAYGRVTTVAAEVGLTLHLDLIKRTPNTLNAHRLIHWAGIEGKQTAAVDALFAAYFTQGRDIGDAEVLCDIADAIGMDASVVARLLASDADAEDIRARDVHSRQMGVSAVPTFIVAHRHAVQGAQPAEVWERVIDDILAQDAAAASADS
jgi:predicted DsbA family dithiol-disulfide isomerase